MLGERAVPVTADQPAPYAPASAVLDLVTRHRNRGLQSPVDADVLARSGISDSLIPRTLQALRVLDLIGEDGRPTEVLEGIRLAPESEYKQRLADWLTAAYADALAFVDPATDDEVAIRDAFRKYNPTGQQSRMVTLFMGLFIAAGVMPDRQRSAAPKKAASPSVPKPPSRIRPVARPAAVPATLPARAFAADGNLPPALAGLLASLPAGDTGWTQDKRDKFMSAFGVLLDFCVPIVAASAAQDNGG